MGPDKFTSDFEKSLLVSMISPIVSRLSITPLFPDLGKMHILTTTPQLCECMRLRQPCVFEEPAWQSVLRSVIVSKQDFSPRCASYYELAAIGSRIPRLFLELHDAIADEDSIPDEEIDDLEARCRGMKAELAVWRREYDMRSVSCKPLNSKTVRTADVRSEALCGGLVMQAMLCRLIGALSPSDRVAEEKEAVAHSMQLTGLFCANLGSNDYASFYIQQKLIFGESILATSDLWLRGCREDGEHRPGGGLDTKRRPRMIDMRTFLAWYEGMPVTDDTQIC
jgi:hypothetical protein